VPKIEWSGLPPALRNHLFDRLRDRKITVDDLYQLGEGRYPKTFLLRDQAAKGKKL
jgi:hypothetical protein